VPPAVITTAYGYGVEAVEPFLRSLHEVCPDADVVLFRENADPSFVRGIAALHPGSRIEVPRRGRVERALRGLPGTPRRALGALLARFLEMSPEEVARRGMDPRCCVVLDLLQARFFYALGLLEDGLAGASRVLLSDVRDVVFQTNPFEGIASGLTTGLEEERISRCPHNRKWVERVFGAEGLRSIGDARIACAGVTVGTRDEVIAYLERMCEEAAVHLSKLAFRNLDQAIHNWLVYRHPALGFRLAETGGDQIATLAHSRLEDFRFDPERGLMTHDGVLISVLHQYDRIPELHAWCRRRWGSGAAAGGTASSSDRAVTRRLESAAPAATRNHE
jgi:hypothetical protein